MLYFAYGSNMCTGRLRGRVPSASPLFRAQLVGHSFRFHKRSKDGSAKADAYKTNNLADTVWGVVFEIAPAEKPNLDRAEGLNQGYIDKTVGVVDETAETHQVLIYVADPSAIDASLRPYSWYKRFVVEGARQHELPVEYVQFVERFDDIDDPDQNRETSKRAIRC